MKPFDVEVRGQIVTVQPILAIDPYSLVHVVKFTVEMHGKSQQLHTSFNMGPTRAATIEIDDSILWREIKDQVTDEITQYMTSRL
jgi:hypothetical protein